METLIDSASVRCALGALFFWLIASCHPRDEKIYSEDLTGLQKIVTLDIVLTQARWDIFGTPEYTGGVPGATDYFSLVAEVPALDATRFAQRARTSTVWVVPEAARPWLSADHRALLSALRGVAVDLSISPHCRSMQARLQKTGREVSGFVCNGKDTAVIYLTLTDYSAGSS